MTAKKLHLAAFVSAGPVSGSHGGWRHPKAGGDLLSANYYQDIGRLLEQGRFDLFFIPDIVAIPDTLGHSLDSQLRHGAPGALRLDPLLVLSVVAATTKNIGLGVTISTTYTQPYILARALATLDHLSGGRAAWNIVTSFQQAEARNFGLTDQLSRDERYDRADEFLDVTTKLWNSWRDDALIRDRETPLFADPDRCRGSITPESGSMCGGRSM
jgi:alkanesulfonate monooxygenase SsuD/methylene tetrahydromethanopterin reductase-like flavin-dependent oxidoreductase (luciferase family)